ncbi:MAG: rubrerythrin family protein, partial [Oscillospiraceae bacterium]|nr:rubrerythrin family protein [Oscillospiraceae bacterium]
MQTAYENYHKGNVDFMDSRTRENLMRAFAGESQARNRYTIAASAARKEKLELVARTFEFTADQERAHAKVFYDLLLPSYGANITIDGNYPVDLSYKTLDLLKAARHNEHKEFDHDYAEFAK